MKKQQFKTIFIKDIVVIFTCVVIKDCRGKFDKIFPKSIHLSKCIRLQPKKKYPHDSSQLKTICFSLP